MPNMDYCRFENTAADVHDCTHAVMAMADGVEEPITGREKQAFARLLGSFADMIGSIATHTGVSPDQIFEMLDCWDSVSVAEKFLSACKFESIDEADDEE